MDEIHIKTFFKLSPYTSNYRINFFQRLKDIVNYLIRI